jgi:hypothetical protein
MKSGNNKTVQELRKFASPHRLIISGGSAVVC